jgi:hypothetical protein
MAAALGYDKPLCASGRKRCDSRAPKPVLDEAPIQKAVQYSLNHEQALRRFLEDGRLPLSNNISERELRREAIGRRNWLFVGSDDGAKVNAVSLACSQVIDCTTSSPADYLRDILCLLPDWPRVRLFELAPAYRKQTRQQHDTQGGFGGAPEQGGSPARCALTHCLTCGAALSATARFCTDCGQERGESLRDTPTSEHALPQAIGLYGATLLLCLWGAGAELHGWAMPLWVVGLELIVATVGTACIDD